MAVKIPKIPSDVGHVLIERNLDHAVRDFFFVFQQKVFTAAARRAIARQKVERPKMCLDDVLHGVRKCSPGLVREFEETLRAEEPSDVRNAS